MHMDYFSLWQECLLNSHKSLRIVQRIPCYLIVICLASILPPSRSMPTRTNKLLDIKSPELKAMQNPCLKENGLSLKE